MVGSYSYLILPDPIRQVRITAWRYCIDEEMEECWKVDVAVAVHSGVQRARMNWCCQVVVVVMRAGDVGVSVRSGLDFGCCGGLPRK